MTDNPFGTTTSIDWEPARYEFEPDDLGHDRGAPKDILEAWSTAITSEGKAAAQCAPWLSQEPTSATIGASAADTSPADLDQPGDGEPDRDLDDSENSDDHVPNRRRHNTPPTRHRKRRPDAPDTPRPQRVIDGKNGSRPRVWNPTTGRYHAISDRHANIMTWLLRVGYATNQQTQRRFWDGPVDRTTSQRVLAHLVATGFLGQDSLDGEAVYYPTQHAVTWAGQAHPDRVPTGPMRNLGAGRTTHTLMLTDLVIEIERHGWATPLDITAPVFVTEREIEVTDAPAKLTPFEAKARDAAAKLRGPERVTEAERGLARAAVREGLDRPRTAVWSLPRYASGGFHRPDMMLWQDAPVAGLAPAGLTWEQWIASRVAIEVEESPKTPSEYQSIMRTYAAAHRAGLVQGVVYVSTQPRILARVRKAAQDTGTEDLLATQHRPWPGLWAAWPGRDAAHRDAIGPVEPCPLKAQDGAAATHGRP